MFLRMSTFSAILVLTMCCSNTATVDKKIINTSNSLNQNNIPSSNTLSDNKTESENQSREKIIETNEERAEHIIGTWKEVYTSVGIGGEKLFVRDYEIFWTFNKDGSGIFNKYFKGLTPGSGELTKLKWKLKDKKILSITKNGEESDEIEFYEQTSTYMIWKRELTKGLVTYTLLQIKKN